MPSDLKIINNTSLREVFAKVHKYRKPKSINWKHNFKILMDYARQWAKREKEDLETLSECVNSVRSLIQIIKVTSYNVVSRIIYEWGTCTDAIRRLRFEIVKIGIMQHVFVIKNC
jgi:hypothetical protein